MNDPVKKKGMKVNVITTKVFERGESIQCGTLCPLRCFVCENVTEISDTGKKVNGFSLAITDTAARGRPNADFEEFQNNSLADQIFKMLPAFAQTRNARRVTLKVMFGRRCAAAGGRKRADTRRCCLEPRLYHAAVRSELESPR
ncbi:hypothetical protein EVAR_89112_1 [Eumeta japonica]|uniref:Uncharacterized protein n=1 Tax=Eumeta variegata TaxID=151549 RepID=A0A4C1XFI5_EUMVA|nr:hypothetical protein EVAR_89112_1 [Eumeta japonica]